MRRLAVLGLLSLAGLTLLAASASLAASPIRQLTNTSASTLRPAWSPDGRRIAFQSNADGPYHVYVMDADGSNVRRVTSGDQDDRHPAWSPDGRYLAMDSGDPGHREIWVSEVATGARTQLTKLGATTSFPSWSPDGKRISFYVYREGAMDLWTVASDGTGAAPLTRGLARESALQCTFACHAASWSPDGSRVALSDGDQARVLLMSALVAGPATPISPAGERSHFPLYLADGSVVYVTEHISLDQSWTDLWAVRPDTGAARSEVTRGIRAQGPFALSGDGRQLLFASPRSGNFEIYAATLDDAGKAALAAKPDQSRPSVTPGAVAPAREETWSGPALVLLSLLTLILGASAWVRRHPRPDR